MRQYVNAMRCYCICTNRPVCLFVSAVVTATDAYKKWRVCVVHVTMMECCSYETPLLSVFKVSSGYARTSSNSESVSVFSSWRITWLSNNVVSGNRVQKLFHHRFWNRDQWRAVRWLRPNIHWPVGGRRPHAHGTLLHRMPLLLLSLPQVPAVEMPRYVFT